MKLARLVHRNNSPWWVRADMEVNPPIGTKINPPIGTIVQYERDVNDWYSVYFPGVHGCASMPGSMFSTYFEDLDDEVS